jgi:aryl-alcohol dehydrogenase-like predicted oxidoreductase
MHRFNMAHRKAATAVFRAADAAGIPIVAFTATRWGTLLRGHPEWSGPVPTAAECYQFCLAAPAVQVVLSAPKTTRQLRANLGILQADAMTSSTMAAWESYGDVVYAGGRDRFERMWP